MSKAKEESSNKKGTQKGKENVADAMISQLDSLIDPLDETKILKKNQKLLEKLEKRLHFSYTELKCLLIMYFKLEKEAQSFTKKQDGITKEQFREFLHDTLDMTDDKLMEKIFLTIDKESNTGITMETWASSLSLLLKGTLDEHIQFCFSVYDFGGDGLLGGEKIFQLLRSSIISQLGTEDAERTVREMVDLLTKKMDLDNDGKLSFQDYRRSVLKNPLLLEAFGQCLPSRMAAFVFLSTFTVPKDAL